MMRTTNGACWSSIIVDLPNLTPPQSVSSNYWTNLSQIVCCLILGLLRKLQCENKLHQTKKDTLYFGSDQRN